MATGVRITSEEAFDYISSVCDRQNKTKEAVKYCLECKDYCCQSCTDIHKVFSVLIGHTLLDAGQGKQSGSKTIHFPTERCCKHEGKILDMYCESHDEVVCYTCVAIDHKSCPDSKIYSVPDMLSTLSKFSDSRQTQRHLKQMIDSMTKLKESKDARLETLNGARKKALEQVTKFQNALEIIFRKAADVSRNEIELGYKRLKTEILQDKSNIDDTNKVILKDDNKIDKAASNEAQRFVCSKIAEKSIKMAADVKIKQEKIDNTDVVLSFVPNKPLMEYVKSLIGIGEVLVGTQEKAQVSTKKKHGLYKLTNSRDINIKVPDDSSTCSSYGCCLINDHNLFVTDYKNKKLKRFDVKTLTLIDSCTLNSNPYDVCSISIDTVAVACTSQNKVQFVSIQDKMVPTKSFDTDHRCYGIAVKEDKLCVTTSNISKPVYVYNMTGTLLKTIDAPGHKTPMYTYITFNESGDKMFLGVYRYGLICFDGKDKHLSTITDSDLSGVEGVCTDRDGNVFVVGRLSNTVVQYNEDGTKTGVVVKGKDGLQTPQSVAFHQGLNRLFVTMLDSNVLKVYELE